MEDTRLARQVVDQLAPFLMKLIIKQPLTTGASAEERDAYALWDAIYPKVALRSAVMMAVRKMVEDDTPEHRLALSNQLAQVFRINRFLAAKIKQLLPVLNQKSSSMTPRPQPHLDPAIPRAPVVAKEFGADQISCQVCDVQDETLRLISYPFVFSLVVITFRRMFQGVYCARHANRYFGLAVLITLSVGWLGIPFGLIFTPITLFNLFTADKRLRPANAKLLMEIAKSKLEHGNLGDAAVYYQESLWLGSIEPPVIPAPQIMASLVSLIDRSLTVQVFALINGFAAAWLMGFLIGLVNGLLSAPFTALGGRVTILVIIFSTLPLVLMLFWGSFLLARTIRRMLERTLITSVLIGRVLAGFAASLAFYAILTGNLFFYVRTVGIQPAVTLLDAIRLHGLLLVHGGWFKMVGLVQIGSTADLLFVVLVILGFMAFMWLGQDWASQTVRWRKRLQDLAGFEAQNSGVLVAFFALMIMGVLGVLLGLVFFPI